MPQDSGARIEATLAPLRDRYAGARWIPPRHLHLTLVFLGTVPSRQVPSIAGVMSLVAARHAAMEVALGGGSGVTRRAEDGIAWLAVSTGAEAIGRLAQDLRQELGALPASPRMLQPPKSWQPHLTVARHAPTALIKELQGLPGPADGVTWRAASVVLFRSHLGPPGARYEPVEVAPLRRV